MFRALYVEVTTESIVFVRIKSKLIFVNFYFFLSPKVLTSEMRFAILGLALYATTERSFIVSRKL